MSTTIGPSGRVYTRLAAHRANRPLLELLRFQCEAADDGTSDLFLGEIVAHVAQPNRLRTLSDWSAESMYANALEQLGRTAWSDPNALAGLRLVGDARTVKHVYRNYLASHYLVAMAAARAPLVRGEVFDFTERFRLLLVVRALEAVVSTVLREKHLRRVCAVIREACDETTSPKWQWIQRLTHPHWELGDFVSETRFKAHLASNTAETSADHKFYKDVLSILDRQWSACDSIAQYADKKVSANIIANWDAPAYEALDEGPDVVMLAPLDAEAASSMAVAKVNRDAPPLAQREEANGLILQTLEDSQYLRHSWHHLSKEEEGALLDRCAELLDGKAHSEQLGAALIIISVLTSTPLSSLSRVSVCDELRDDWTLDLNRGCLRRRPPRFGRRWRKPDHAEGWVRRLENEWLLQLPQQVLQPLTRSVANGQRGAHLSELWSMASNLRLEAWFATEFAATRLLERLTAPCLPIALGQKVFDASQDHILARLVGSHTRTGLPASCAYASFNGADVRNSLESPLVSRFADVRQLDIEANAAGSELDPIHERLKEAIVRLTQRVGKATDLVEYHNRLTTLCVVTLLASTGARPVTSPFESLSWIDRERKLIYVEDKHSGPARGSRICVLTDFAQELLDNTYLPHLDELSTTPGLCSPQFSSELQKLRSGVADCRLPLFFLLRAQPHLAWIEVSESQLDSVSESPWPLPWNLFRHLHSTQLRRKRLHPDIRDALLGHGDAGAESHGDFSWRVPRADLEEARVIINEFTRSLGFETPPERRSFAQMLQHKHFEALQVDDQISFGRTARRERRDKFHELARTKAATDLDQAIGKRPPESLSPDDWDAIAKRMLFRDDGLPHTMSSLRYEVFETKLESLWRDQGIKPKLARRWVAMREARPLFSEELIAAPRRLDDWRTNLDKVERQISRTPGPVLAGLLAGLELALHCRIDHFEVLSAVARNSDSVKIVRFLDQLWLEWAPHGKWLDGRPVYRAPITDRALSWIGLTKLAKKTLKALPRVPAALSGFAEGSPNAGALLRRVANAVAAQNAYELPGVIAATVSGRIESSALPHRDWVRQASGRVFDDTTAPSVASAEMNFTTGGQLLDRPASTSSSTSGTALKRCRDLFDIAEQALGDTQTSSEGKPVARVERAIKESGFGFGDAPLVLARYACHLLTRSKKTADGQTLRPSTRVRYWYALAPGFLDFAFDVNLPALDDDELTELYTKICAAAEEPLPGNTRRRTLKDDSDASRRTLAELQEFHEFAQAAYGLEDPDWDEISPGVMASRGRPGLVLMPEYKAALKALTPSEELDRLDEISLASGFVLIACFRFGLRVGEAVGLHANDWIEIASSTVVLVRPNSVRSIKTTRSKRQVPLVERLDAIERDVVAEVRRRWSRDATSGSNTPLLSDVSASTYRSMKARLSNTLLPLLKSITRNPSTTIHHLRHSFAGRMLELLSGDDRALSSPKSSEETLAARRLLLGGVTPDRRTIFAIARLLGHASASTSSKSYLRLSGWWTPAMPKRERLFDVIESKCVLNLDGLPQKPLDLHGPFRATTSLAPAETLFVRLLRYLRLRSVAHPTAAALSLVSTQEQSLIEEMLKGAVAKMGEQTEDSSEPAAVLKFLARISEARWKALVEIAKSSPPSQAWLQASDWLGMIGRNRQILLFLDEHCERVADFLRCIDPEARALEIVRPTELDDAFQCALERHGLSNRLVMVDTRSKGFQLDVATLANPTRTYKDRVAMMIKSGSEVNLKTTFEVVVLWIAWLTGRSTQTH